MFQEKLVIFISSFGPLELIFIFPNLGLPVLWIKQFLH